MVRAYEFVVLAYYEWVFDSDVVLTHSVAVEEVFVNIYLEFACKFVECHFVFVVFAFDLSEICHTPVVHCASKLVGSLFRSDFDREGLSFAIHLAIFVNSLDVDVVSSVFVEVEVPSACLTVSFEVVGSFHAVLVNVVAYETKFVHSFFISRSIPYDATIVAVVGSSDTFVVCSCSSVRDYFIYVEVYNAWEFNLMSVFLNDSYVLAFSHFFAEFIHQHSLYPIVICAIRSVFVDEEECACFSIVRVKVCSVDATDDLTLAIDVECCLLSQCVCRRHD